MNIMKKFLAATAIICVSAAIFTGCGDSGSDSDKNDTSSSDSQSADEAETDSVSDDENESGSEVVGKWEITEVMDHDKGMEVTEIKGIPIAEFMHIEINSDGTYHTWISGNDEDFDGSWTLSGNKLTLTSSDDDTAEFDYKDGHIIAKDGGNELTFSKVSKFTAAGEDSDGSEVVGKWEASEIIEGGTAYTDEYNDVPIALIMQMEINSDGTLTAMSAAADNDVSGTWELDGDKMTTFVNNKTEIFEFKDGRLIFKNNGSQMTFKKVSQFTE